MCVRTRFRECYVRIISRTRDARPNNQEERYKGKVLINLVGRYKIRLWMSTKISQSITSANYTLSREGKLLLLAILSKQVSIKPNANFLNT